jgi:peptidoglycan hydrolase-like protein with peptidoglycan-binding domain
MSVGHPHSRPNETHPAELRKLMAQPSFRAMWARPFRVNDTKQVSDTGGYNVAGDIYYRDRDFVQAVRSGHITVPNMTADQILEAVLLHERTEKCILDSDTSTDSYLDAHEFSTLQEHEFVRGCGATPRDYEKALAPIMSYNDTKPLTDAPPDLACAPYLDESDFNDKRALKEMRQLGVTDAHRVSRRSVGYTKSIGPDRCGVCKNWQRTDQQDLGTCTIVSSLVRQSRCCNKFQRASLSDNIPPTPKPSPKRTGIEIEVDKILQQIIDVPVPGSPDSRFDLLQNPFILLGVTPNATAQEVKRAYEDALEDDTAPLEVLQKAQQAVLTPRLRLDAELGGFIDVVSTLATQVIAKLKAGAGHEDLKGAIASLHALPKSNVLAHLAGRTPPGEAHLLDLLKTQAMIAPGAVYDAVSDAREHAESGKVERETVAQALAALKERQVKSTIDSLVKGNRFPTIFMMFVRRVLEARNEEHVAELDTYVRAYSQAVSAEFSRRREQVISACQAIRTDPKNKKAIDQLGKMLEHWQEIGHPLQIFEAYKNREEPLARDLYLEIRNLCVWLANEKEEFEAARTITLACTDVFKELPRALGQMGEEGELLAKLRSEQIAVTLLEPLSKAFTEVQDNHRRFEKDVLGSGFGPASAGLARALYEQFVEAVNKVSGTEIAELPWRLVRAVAVSLNNESQSPKAAAAVINGLMAFAALRQPSSAIMDLLQEDQKAARKVLVKTDLEQSVKARRWTAVIQLIDQLLALEADQSERVTLTEMRDTVAAKQRSNRIKGWFWFGAAAVLLIVVISNQDNHPKYSPPSYQPVPAPPSAPPSSYFPPPSPQRPTEVPRSLASEERPPVGSNLNFTQANIRYCSFQEVRLEAARRLVTDADVSYFNDLVSDWNSRCSAYRYRPSDKQVVDAEVPLRRMALESEAGAVVREWPSRQRLRQFPSAAAAAPPPPQPTFPPIASNDFPATPQPQLSPPAPQLPPPTSIGPSSGPSASSISGRSPKAASLNLLSATEAARVQRRLNELGYTIKPADGTWGPVSRSALRNFKRANDLPADDAFDADTETRLFSTVAVNSPPGVPSEPSEITGMVETTYAAPSGAKMNPLNRVDGQRIQQRLVQLGFYTGKGDGLWGLASRKALRDFKAMDGLTIDDEWDATTELALNDQSAVRASQTIIGGWATDPTLCQARVASSEENPIRIDSTRIEQGKNTCAVKNLRHVGSTWIATAACTGGMTDTFQMTIVGDRLEMTRSTGSASYFRCPRTAP